jgi:hypothetical protein
MSAEGEELLRCHQLGPSQLPTPSWSQPERPAPIHENPADHQPLLHLIMSPVAAYEGCLLRAIPGRPLVALILPKSSANFGPVITSRFDSS